MLLAQAKIGFFRSLDPHLTPSVPKPPSAGSGTAISRAELHLVHLEQLPSPLSPLLNRAMLWVLFDHRTKKNTRTEL